MPAIPEIVFVKYKIPTNNAIASLISLYAFPMFFFIIIVFVHGKIHQGECIDYDIS